MTLEEKSDLDSFVDSGISPIHDSLQLEDKAQTNTPLYSPDDSTILS